MEIVLKIGIALVILFDCVEVYFVIKVKRTNLDLSISNPLTP